MNLQGEISEDCTEAVREAESEGIKGKSSAKLNIDHLQSEHGEDRQARHGRDGKDGSSQEVKEGETGPLGEAMMEQIKIVQINKDENEGLKCELTEEKTDKRQAFTEEQKEVSENLATNKHLLQSEKENGNII